MYVISNVNIKILYCKNKNNIIIRHIYIRVYMYAVGKYSLHNAKIACDTIHYMFQ